MTRYFINTMNLAILCLGILNIQVSNAQSVSYGDLPTYLNDINTHATRDFLRRFDNPVDVKWHKEKGGYIATCILRDIKTTIAYNRKGDWVYTIKYYTESKLPREVRAFVKSVYYNNKITKVKKIVQKIKNEPVYQVQMKGENTGRFCWSTKTG